MLLSTLLLMHESHSDKQIIWLFFHLLNGANKLSMFHVFNTKRVDDENLKGYIKEAYTKENSYLKK